MRVAPVAVLLLVALSCSTHRPPRSELGKAFKVSYGSSTEIRGEGLVLAFAEVDEDSRCPTGATCIQAGQATVVLRTTKGGSNAESVRVTIPTPGSAIFQNYKITLVDLAPHPSVGKLPRKDEYAATLIVER